MNQIEPSFGREFAKNLGWMMLILIGMCAAYALFGLLIYVASEQHGIPGIIVVTVIGIVAVVFVMTIAGRIARRRIRARYACDVAAIGRAQGKIH